MTLVQLADNMLRDPDERGALLLGLRGVSPLPRAGRRRAGAR